MGVMRLHDSHFHLDLMEDPERVVDLVESAKVYTIAVTNAPFVFSHTKNLTLKSKYIRPALGLHPELVAGRHHEIALFEEYLPLTRYIGEVGLDKTGMAYAKQKEVFEKIVELTSDAGQKVLTVHSRKAEKDLIDIVGEGFSGKLILHWYSGSIKSLETAIARGYYVSFNSKMLQTKSGMEILDCVPLTRVLVESDSPFAGATRFFSKNVISSIYRSLHAKKARELDFDTFVRQLHQNFKRLLE